MRSYFRNKLHKLLGETENEGFIQLLWAVHGLQSRYADVARRYVRADTIPDGVISGDVTNPLAIHKWEIETLVNEAMTVKKAGPKRNGMIRTRKSDHFGLAIDCVNCLRKLDNAEYAELKKDESVFREMARIASRQFGWQRGFDNLPHFYRNAFVYGQGVSAEYFENKNGISINKFSQVGFLFYASFQTAPVVKLNVDWQNFDVSRDEIVSSLSLISEPYSVLMELATMNRRSVPAILDKPSVLRKAPCIRFGDQLERVRSPLPELIIDRVTSGIFYDLVGGDGDVRNDYAKRFEDYCFRYLSCSFPEMAWKREFKYRKKPNDLDSPDIICSEGDAVSMAFECKATRMSYEAKFGKFPEKTPGFDEIAKAVFQLWRFFSHCRRGFAGHQLVAKPLGIVLTLDDWLVMADALRGEVYDRAMEMARASDPEISEMDRKPIVFVPITGLESTLAVASERTFKQALEQSNSEKFKGRQLNSIHRELAGGVYGEARPYPFKDNLDEVLPWLDRLKERSQTR